MIHGNRPDRTSLPPACATTPTAPADQGAANTATGPLLAGIAIVIAKAIAISTPFNSIFLKTPPGHLLDTTISKLCADAQ